MKWRQISYMSALALLSLHLNVAAEPVPLASLHPTRALSYYLKNDASVQPSSIAVALDRSPEAGLRFLGGSEVTYEVPTGQNSFSGVLIYRPEPLQRPGLQSSVYVVLLVRVMADGKLLWQQAMDGTTPAVEFSIPLSGSPRLTIVSEASFVGAVFYLARAAFQSESGGKTSMYLPDSAQGYVDSAPAPEQALAGIYHPGETVPVSAYFAGSPTQADISLHITPEWSGGTAADWRTQIPLHPIEPGLVRGSANWTVPQSRGPAQLEINETVSGRTVFHRQVRIAVGPRIDLADIPDNSFGVQISTSGFPLVYDEFASLWGAKWGRIFVRWATVEANQGQYDFSRFDAELAIYRAQHMHILAVLGEDAPAWVGYPGPRYYPTWSNFVAAAVDHLKGQVDAWDVFNEVDVKHSAYQDKAETDWDLKVLRSGIETIRAHDPTGKIVCCSTGTLPWLSYDRRLLQSSVLSAVDSVSLHPYQVNPPEMKQGALSYVENLAALRALLRSTGIDKHVWSTEATWSIGPPGMRDVSSPGMPEVQQAEYLVRVNLLSISQGVGYITHTPFYTYYHPQPQVATWAAYAEMASLFPRGIQPNTIASGPDVFGVSQPTATGRVGALWSLGAEGRITLEPGQYRFMDMYGNPIQMDPANVQLSPAPIYFELTRAGAPNPHAQALAAHMVPTTLLPSLQSWRCAPDATCTGTGQGYRVASSPKKYASQLTSPVVSLAPNTCQIVQMQIIVAKGLVGMYAIDGVSRQLLDDKKVYVQDVPSDQAQTFELRFHTGSSSSAQVVLTNANDSDTQSIFTVVGSPQLKACQDPR